MVEYSQVLSLDDLDRAILDNLQHDGRISNADLARRINLSAPATHARLKRLEAEGYIKQHVTLLNREKLGFDMICFVRIGLQLHQYEDIQRVRTAIVSLPPVMECHHITGEFDYLLKIVVPDRAALERFVVHQLTPIAGVARINTSLVLSEIKSTTALPLL